jgi:phenylpropionate dioxygenase-like ring-hydroxylating dioxygenase large terminal subunit
MSAPLESAALDAWYVVGRSVDVTPQTRAATRLLGSPIVVTRGADGAPLVTADGRRLPTVEKYGHVWTTLGQPNKPLFSIPEFDEPDRRTITAGAVRVKASGLRLVENFLDMAHFPFVHTDILGVPEQPEVVKYDVEIRDDEVWADNCRFYQPKAAATSFGGIMTDYTYRVLSPFNVMLYKSCPSAPDRMDVICLFIQPIEPDYSYALPVLGVIDSASTDTDVIHFQQTIFLQDRIILENQRPSLLPLSPRMETPTRADLVSVVYRRWLKEKGLRYGALERAA